MGNEATRDRRGVVLALSSAALFGLSAPPAKYFLGDGVPWMSAGCLYLASGLGLVLVRLLTRAAGRSSGEASLTIRDAPRLLAVILSGGVAGPVLLMVGLRLAPASTASLLLNLEGVFTLVVAWVIFHENVDRRVGLGAAAILLGAVALSWDGGVGNLGWGAPAVAGACLAWAVDNNLTRGLSAADPLQIAAIKGTVAGAANIVVALASGADSPTPGFLLAAVLIGFPGYGVSLVLFVSALRRLGTARTGAYFSSAPFIGASASVVFLGEPLTVNLIVAAVLMGIGLYLHLAERHEHPHRHEATRHEHRHVHDEHHRHEHEGWEGPEPHTHPHGHAPIEHTHAHYPDIHHRHRHGGE